MESGEECVVRYKKETLKFLRVSFHAGDGT